MTTTTKTTFAAQSTAATHGVRPGNWLVAGTDLDSLDVGRIVRIGADGEHAMVAWSHGDRTPCPLYGDVAIFECESEAQTEYDARHRYYSSPEYDDCD